MQNEDSLKEARPFPECLPIVTATSSVSIESSRDFLIANAAPHHETRA